MGKLPALALKVDATPGAFLLIILINFFSQLPEIALPEHKFPVLALVFFEIPKMTLHISYFFALTRMLDN